jgi:VIT1/CCC1 family predicted Fe2+/Mn2+ transporter
VKASKKVMEKLQRDEITSHVIYENLSKRIKSAQNRSVLKRVSRDELIHYRFWEKITGKKIYPNILKVWWYVFLSTLFGITFGVRLMEKGEEKAQHIYKALSRTIPPLRKIIRDEEKHEKEMIEMLDEERLKYVGSMVLGLNDALVELTGSLAGFTLALKNTEIIAVTGLIIGLAASLSMAVSEYLSAKTEGGHKNPLKSAIYTGIAYVLTVVILITPYLLLKDVFMALGATLLFAVLIIAFFTYYTSIAKGLSFRKRFFEMAFISLGVAAITFFVGYLIKIFFNVDA